ncbi:hypothetical protein [Priestia megaterium]|uniref:hypothetical protein n=1 Tax=Priestia megaterium TaxID=1404 RepID=UPI000BF3ACB8|nr:hypothetical protein [Priestia megaterium]PFW43796.1 hypothetical protein COL17_26690 [Priestia megaterium]
MGGVKVNFRVLRDNKALISRLASQGAQTAMQDVVNDLAKASSGAAPHLTGRLEDSYTTEVGHDSAYRIKGTVSYSVSEGGYNYAIKMHEGNYNLGAGSQAKNGGQGMSGKSYPVGNKFLTRPLEGEADAYSKHLEKGIKNQLR